MRLHYHNYYYELIKIAIASIAHVNNANHGGELWEGRALDGKLKSSLEWPYIRAPIYK